jgi:hypothetical protein
MMYRPILRCPARKRRATRKICAEGADIIEARILAAYVISAALTTRRLHEEMRAQAARQE